MKKLLLLLLLPLSLMAQPVRSPNQYLKGVTGKPTSASSSINDFAIDWKAGVVWRSVSTSNTASIKWVQETDTNVVKFYLSSGSGTQGPKGDKGDTGAQGPQGPIGATGPAGQNGVCPSCPPSGGGGSYVDIYHVITNGVDDTPNIQRAVDSSYVTGRKVFLDGYLRMGSGIKIKKDQSIVIEGSSAKITATNTGSWIFFYSDVPASVAEAEGVYAFRKIKFVDLVLQGQGTQSGFDLYATEGASYDRVWCYDMATAFNLTFALRTRVIQCEANTCTDGLVIQSGSGRIPGASTSTACSNGTTVEDFRAYAGATTNTGIKIYDASLVKVDGYEAEGNKFNIAFDYQAMSPTSTGANLVRYHFEAANACTISAIKVRSSTMVHVFDQLNLIKPSVYFAVDNAGGYPSIKMSNISNQRVYWNGTTKIFDNGAGSTWKFSNCDNPINSTDLPKMFKNSISNGCGVGAGANTWCIENPINR